jgi:hypothetical protein
MSSKAFTCYDYNTWTTEYIWKQIDGPVLSTIGYSFCLEECELGVKIESKQPGVYRLTESFKGKGEGTLQICKEKKSLCMYLIDVDRKLSKKDNHDSGLHVNLIWLDTLSKRFYRFDPYYAKTIQDSVEMQNALDKLCQEILVPKSYQYHSTETQEIPFGPQLLDSSAKEARVKSCGKEEFCVPWCLVVAQTILKHFQSTNQKEILTPTVALQSTLKQMKLSIPKTEKEAMKQSEQYYNTMRQVLV